MFQHTPFRPVLAAAAFLLLSTASVPALAEAKAEYSMPQVLEVFVNESVEVTPDIAQISAGVVTSAVTANQALQDNATRMTAVYAALRKAGIAEKDMQTAGVSLNPQYDYNNRNQSEGPRLTGYQASNTVNVKVRNLKNLGASIDALVAAGANQVNGPHFSVDNDQKHLDTARAAAVRAATARARIYAEAAGLKLGRILLISEGSAPAMPYPVMMKAAAMDSAARTPIAPGEVSLGVGLTVRFELVP